MHDSVGKSGTTKGKQQQHSPSMTETLVSALTKAAEGTRKPSTGGAVQPSSLLSFVPSIILPAAQIDSTGQQIQSILTAMNELVHAHAVNSFVLSGTITASDHHVQMVQLMEQARQIVRFFFFFFKIQ